MSSLVVEELGVVLAGREVLCGIHLAAAPGSWVGLVGPNGAGKTTLLRAIAGAVPHTGCVSIGADRTSGMSRRSLARSVAWVPQEPVLPAGMPVADYVLLGRLAHLSYLAREGASDRAIVNAVLERLALVPLASRSLETLSGGERRRAAVARALAQETPVLLLDEPTAALDIGRQQDVLELIAGLRAERHLTVIAAMHDLTLSGQYADRLTFLEAGRVVLEGTPSEVLTEAAVRQRYGASVRVLDSESPQLRAVVPVRRGPRTSPGRIDGPP
jgi:iron complex transport system ATP-binding protein